MPKKGVRENAKFDIESLALSIKAWLDYYMSVNQEYALSESTLHYPICNYLAQFSGKVILEEPLLIFNGNKSCDVYFGKKRKKCYIELKYAQKDYTSTSSELLRIFEDLLRLKTMSLGQNVKCYFIICGPKNAFKNDFVEYGTMANQPNPWNSKLKTKKKKPRKYKALYIDMFPFEVNKTKTVDLKDDKFKKLWEDFKEGYSLSTIGKNKFKDMKALRRAIGLFDTKAECYYGEDASGRSAIGVWKIE